MAGISAGTFCLFLTSPGKPDPGICSFLLRIMGPGLRLQERIFLYKYRAQFSVARKDSMDKNKILDYHVLASRLR